MKTEGIQEATKSPVMAATQMSQLL